MFAVIAETSLGNIKWGQTIATFQVEAFAKAHYWVEKGWARVERVKVGA